MRKLLLGDTAFVDNVGICEFPAVVKELNDKIKTFHVVIFPSNDAKQLVNLQVKKQYENAV